MKNQTNQSTIEWREVLLEEICKIVSGSTPSTSNPEYWDGTINWVTPAELIDGNNWYYYKTQRKISDKGLKSCSSELFPKGTVMLTSRAPIGKVAIAGTEMCSNQGFKNFICDKNKINKEYLYYWLRSKKEYLNSIGRGATFKEISKTIVSKLKIPLPFSNGKPDLAEQERIVSILEKAEKLKEKGKKAKDLLDEYLKSVFNEMFGDIVSNNRGWNKINAEELFDMKLGKMLSARNYTGKNLKPYLRNVNVRWGYLDLSDVKKMDFNENEYNKYQLKKGDILVCEGGEVGRTAIYSGEISNCCYQNALHRLRIKKPVIAGAYFICYMQFAAKYGLILRDTSQVTIAHFTAEKFKKFKILLPPISLQKQFAAMVEKIESLKQKQSDSTSDINNLFDALMQKAFNGELVS